MNLVDSSGWLEYLAGGRNSKFFVPAVENLPKLIVPTICIYEVFKRIVQQRNEDDALQAVALMHQGRVVDLDAALALDSARMSDELKLPMADSIILATARHYQATLWTQDADFKGMDNVKFFDT